MLVTQTDIADKKIFRHKVMIGKSVKEKCKKTGTVLSVECKRANLVLFEYFKQGFKL